MALRSIRPASPFPTQSEHTYAFITCGLELHGHAHDFVNVLCDFRTNMQVNPQI